MLAYLREKEGERMLIALNFKSLESSFYPAGHCLGRVALSSQPDREGEVFAGGITLRGHEGLVIRLGQ